MPVFTAAEQLLVQAFWLFCAITCSQKHGWIQSCIQKRCPFALISSMYKFWCSRNRLCFRPQAKGIGKYICFVGHIRKGWSQSWGQADVSAGQNMHLRPSLFIAYGHDLVSGHILASWFDYGAWDQLFLRDHQRNCISPTSSSEDGSTCSLYWKLFADVSGQPIGHIFKVYADPWLVHKGRTVCPQNSVNNYLYTLSYNPEERRTHLHRGENVNSPFYCLLHI
jgi:hypothetical protein